MRCISSCFEGFRPTHHSRPPQDIEPQFGITQAEQNDDFDLSASSRNNFKTPAANRHRVTGVGDHNLHRWLSFKHPSRRYNRTPPAIPIPQDSSAINQCRTAF